MNYGLNTNFLTYTSRVQAVEKQMKCLDIDVQYNKSSNLRKSMIYNLNKGTTVYYDI